MSSDWEYQHFQLNYLRELAEMWYYDDDDEPIFNDILRAAFMRSLQERILVEAGLRQIVGDEPQEYHPQEIEEARRLKQTGLPHLNVPTIEPEFGRFFDDPTYSDITLVVGSRTFYAHRLILSSWSNVFQDILKASEEHLTVGASAEDEGLRIYRLKEDSDCCEVFDTFLKFLYTEEVTFSEDTIMPLLKLSNKYKIDELNKLCDRYVGDLEIDVSSAISVLIQAMKYNMAHTIESCISVLRSNFELISAEQLQVLDSSVIIAVLDPTDQSLVVKDEFSLFQKLTPWLANCTDSDTFKTVVGCIRFPFMSALQLKAVGSSDIIRRLKEVSPTFLDDAFEQHSLYREAFVDEIHTPVPLPRLYLNPPVSLFGQSGNGGTTECDEEGFIVIPLTLMDVTEYRLQNVLVNGRKESARNHYKFDDSKRLFIGVEPFHEHVKKEDNMYYFLFGLKISLLRKSETTLHFYPGVGAYVQRVEEALFADQVVEVAVQIKYDDGSSHLFSSRRSLTSKDQDQHDQVEDEETDDKSLFSFETPCLLQSLPKKVKIRVSVVIHQRRKSQSHDK